MKKIKSITTSPPRLHAASRSSQFSRIAVRTTPLFAKWWFLLALLFMLGIIAIVSTSVVNSFSRMQFSGGQATVSPVTRVHVQRSGSYDEAVITIVDALNTQYFSDDPIHQGQSTVRLSVQVANPTSHSLGIVYYDVVRLLLPKGVFLSPVNIQLSADVNPGKTVSGWIDFALPYKSVALNSLTLQLGNASLDETLVKIPFSGAYNPTQYTSHLSSQRTVISYNFYGQTLVYYLVSVQTRFAYDGVECKVGQQYYVLNFKVDNVQNKDVSPGYGFDYIRLVLPNNERAPVDNSLPYTFKAGAKGVSGYVVFLAPKDMKELTLGFLSQNGTGELDTMVHL